MRRTLLLGLFHLLTLNAQAGETLDRNTRFPSLDAFVSAILNFQPAENRDWLAYQFGAVELGQPEIKSTGAVTLPKKVDSCAIIWRDLNAAVLFTVARPTTIAAPSAVGLLVTLTRVGTLWQITDTRRFTATGKYASLDCKLTAGAD